MKHLHFSTFRLFDFSKLKMRPFHFSTFRLLEILFTLTYFPTKPCSVFFQPRRISYIGGKTMDKPMNSGGFFPSADGMGEAQQRQLLTGESGAGASQRCTARVQGQCFSLGIDDLMSTSLINILQINKYIYNL